MSIRRSRAILSILVLKGGILPLPFFVWLDPDSCHSALEEGSSLPACLGRTPILSSGPRAV